jgi:hypothetical protein
METVTRSTEIDYSSFPMDANNPKNLERWGQLKPPHMSDSCLEFKLVKHGECCKAVPPKELIKVNQDFVDSILFN